MDILLDKDVYLIIISGVLIFVVQKLISDLWILPNIEFQKCLGKLDVLLIRYEFLCGYEYGSNEGSNDEDGDYFKAELKNIVMDLISKYRALFSAERWWCRYVLKINVNQTKPQILLLSQLISTKKDVMVVDSKAGQCMKNIRINLKFKEFKIDYGNV